MPLSLLRPKALPQGYDALLPGRATWIRLCHQEPAACAECRRRIAIFLVGELGHDRDRAFSRTPAVYRLDLGWGATLDQARQLRLLTMHLCAPDVPMPNLHLVPPRHLVPPCPASNASAPPRLRTLLAGVADTLHLLIHRMCA